MNSSEEPTVSILRTGDFIFMHYLQLSQNFQFIGFEIITIYIRVSYKI